MVESWTNADGETRERRNRVVIEVVGRDAENVASKAALGCWATVEGYIRSEQFKGQDLTKVRTLQIEIWEPADEHRKPGADHARSAPGEIPRG